MSAIELYDVTALFGVFLETNKHQNLMRPRCSIKLVHGVRTSFTNKARITGSSEMVSDGVLDGRLLFQLACNSLQVRERNQVQGTQLHLSLDTPDAR